MASEGVMSTNDDASNCKRYATSKGYWEDDFIQYFVRNIPDRKAPEINRGYYVRHFSVNNLIKRFLAQTGCSCQIISLGSGFDTMFWNLRQQGLTPKHGFFEIDMKPVVQKKIMNIKTKQPLLECLEGEVSIESTQIHSQYYHLLAGDLTNVVELKKLLENSGVQTSVPTLFIVECVFVYIKHDLVQNLLNYISEEFQTCMLIDYDPVNLNDRFGEVMKQNLRGRNCHLLGAHSTLKSKMESYKPFADLQAKLLIDIYMDMPSPEKSRIERIEFLDEVDLLFDMLKHYTICIAKNDNLGIGLNRIEI